MMKLEGKKILFISAYFFGYNKAICSALENMGATVDYFDERPTNTFFIKAIIRMRPELLKKYIQKYHDNIINSIKSTKYDYIFFIKAESITIESLSKLRELQPQAKMVLYLWDSFENFKNGDIKLRFFDKVLSFDRKDCEKYGMIFRPLFYTMDYSEIRNKSTKKNIDILFIGTVHSDRYAFVKKIRDIAKNRKYNVYYYLFFMSKILYYKMKFYNKALRDTKISDFMFKPISQKEIITLFERTKCIIDIQHPNQTGLTMRTLETLGAGNKLITTNSDIINYDFYNSNNIAVVDRLNPEIPASFLDTDIVEVPKNIYDKYSINSWISDILK